MTFSYLLFVYLNVLLQSSNQVNWEVKANKLSENEYNLVFSGKIKKGYYLYNSELKVDGPIKTSTNLENLNTIEFVSNLEGINPKTKYDPIWEGEIAYFDKKALFNQKVKIKPGTTQLNGNIKYQTCSESDGRCVMNNHKFEIKL